jgi:hypothetical protein
VNYLIGNTVTVAGTHGYTMTAIAIPHAVALVGNAQQNVVYTSISSTAASNASEIEALNLLTGTSTFSAQPLGGWGTLALSDDGQYLYTSSGAGVQQVQTSNLTVSLSIAAPGIDSIAVAPGEPQTIAVTGTEAPLQIFDKAVARPNSLAPGATENYGDLHWGTDTNLYTDYFIGAGPTNSCNVPVDASGVSKLGTCDYTDNGQGYNYANGLGYGPGGTVVDTTTNWNAVGTLTAPNASIPWPPLPDTILGRVFAIGTTTSLTSCVLLSFNLTTLAPIASLHLPADSGGSCLAGIGKSSTVRWGTNGLALLASDYLIVISGTFVAP